MIGKGQSVFVLAENWTGTNCILNQILKWVKESSCLIFFLNQVQCLIIDCCNEMFKVSY